MARKRTIDRIGQRGNFDEEGGKPEDEQEAEEEEEEAEDEGEEADEEEASGDDDDDAPPKKKAPKKKAPPKKKPATKRSRAAKVVRQKAIWVIFDNASKQVETFPYSQKDEAERFLAEKSTDKKGLYLQMVKVPLDEKEK
jgi:hypothetical protein